MKALFQNNHMLFIMQFVIVLIVLGVWAYLLITKSIVPTTVDSLVTLIIGFFFGAQVNEMIRKGNQP